MLTSHDIKFMNECVSDIVKDWESTLTTLIPLPKEQQNYNELLNEVVGKVKYNRAIIPAERKYIVNNYDHSIESNSAGIKDEGMITFSIPLLINKKEYHPSVGDLYYIDGAVYRVRSIRDRIGENILIFDKNTGIDIDSIEIVGDIVINGD